MGNFLNDMNPAFWEMVQLRQASNNSSESGSQFNMSKDPSSMFFICFLLFFFSLKHFLKNISVFIYI